MASKLIAKLKESTDKDESLKVLQYQWGFDELVIGNALKSVVDTFKHYSLHDDSHSQQILVNIELILGEHGINALTASDIWLLLESAYLHDVGMVIPYADKEELLKDGTFIDFLKNDASTEAEAILDILENQSGGNQLTAKDALQITEKFNQIIAESFRKSHASRAEKIIKTPELIKLRSPRTTLISQRIWDMCAEICRLHGSSFEEVMQLPQKQNGIGNDFFHPRLIACLLRIGDLLDLDNNRFCPVMSCLTGHAQSSTKAHQDKHRATNKLLFDHNNIDITAYCKTPEGYDETRKWFDYIEEEINNQSRYWSDIKPSDEFPALPTVGKLDVALEGWDLNGKERPRFNIASERALKILQGDNIYSSRDQVFRELIQNALDATLIRIWLSDLNKPGTAPTIEDLTDAAKNYPISISLEEEPKSNTDKFKIFKVTITDQGIGFSAADLREFQMVGKPSTERAKTSIIKKMPEFMKPTGSFGIGFQSIFTISNKVTIETTSALEHHRKKIEITQDDNRALTMHIRDLDQSSGKLYTPGTKIEFHIKEDNPPKHFKYFLHVKEHLTPYDPFNNSKSNAVDYQLFIAIDTWATGPTPIVLDAKSLAEKQITLNSGLSAEFYLSENKKIGVANVKPIEDNTSEPKERTHENKHYKWFPVSKARTPGTWLSFDAHVFGYSANEILTIDRNDFLEDKRNIIQKNIDGALIEYINCHKMMQNPYTDAFLELHDQKNEQRWKALMLGKYQLKEIIARERITFDTNTTTNDEQIQVTMPLDSPDGTTATIKCWERQLSENRTIKLLLNHLSKPGGGYGIQLKDYQINDMGNHFHSFRIEFVGGSSNKIDFEKFMKPLLKMHASRSANNKGDYFYNRFLMPCPTDFDNLAIEKLDIGPGFGFAIDNQIQNIVENLIFPFTLKDGIWIEDDAETFGRLIDHAFKHRKLKNTTEDEIRASYNRYMSAVKRILPCV